MMNPTISFISASIITLIVMLLAWVLSAKYQNSRELMSPFECGFDPKGSARIPFSTRFFLLAVLFLIFDIEIVLLLPMPMITHLSNHTSLTFLALMLILAMGLFHEWREGSLEWTN